jgi:hypothetical protein
LKIVFALKQFFGRDTKANLRQVNHFLLDQARLEVTLVFADSSKTVLPALTKNAKGEFILKVEKDAVPDKADGTGAIHKILISSLSMDFVVDVTRGGTTFRVLRIQQQFSLKPLADNSDDVMSYELSPFSWTHSKTLAIRTANGNVHPLLDVRKLSKNQVGVNALVVDLTELWAELHQKNENTKLYNELTEPSKVTLKIFAHLGGNAFIWYCVVAAYLAKSTQISPHVFYSPADYAEKQNISNEKKYLFDNAVQFESQKDSDDANNGHTLLLGYLLPPVDDVRIPALNPKNFSKATFASWVTRTRRNVVNFAYTDSRKKQITPLHWNLGAGFERAFYGLGATKPQQILLMPQVVGGGGAVKGSESDPHVRNITTAIFDLLQSNTDLIATGSDMVIAKDKMVISCYSESGWDLWRSAENNSDHIKAIIGIEPNSTNPKGRDIIPTLLRKKVQVYIIGRHQGFADHYRPKISAALQKMIHFLPREPRKVLKYPPDPDSNDFVKFRVARVTSQMLDPLMDPDEKQILQDLVNRSKPVAGKDAIPFIFGEISNSDKLGAGGLASIFYTHNFALTGGEDMTLADPINFYNKPVTYRTFFQQAVEEIG